MTRLPDLFWTRSRDFRAGPFPATPVDRPGWAALTQALAAGRFTLMSLWGEPGGRRAARRDGGGGFE